MGSPSPSWTARCWQPPRTHETPNQDPAMHACMRSCFSRFQLCATPWTAAHQAPLSTGLSRQECWRGLPFPSKSLPILDPQKSWDSQRLLFYTIVLDNIVVYTIMNTTTYYLMVSWDGEIEQERFIIKTLRGWNSSSTWFTTEINISCLDCLPDQGTTLRQFTVQRILKEPGCLGWTTLQSWNPHVQK